jgi:hypothetical protein
MVVAAPTCTLRGSVFDALARFFALALVPFYFAMASSYLTIWLTQSDSYPGSNFVALYAAIAAGIGLAFLLRARLALKPRRPAASI